MSPLHSSSTSTTNTLFYPPANDDTLRSISTIKHLLSQTPKPTVPKHARLSLQLCCKNSSMMDDILTSPSQTRPTSLHLNEKHTWNDNVSTQQHSTHDTIQRALDDHASDHITLQKNRTPLYDHIKNLTTTQICTTAITMKIPTPS